MRILSYIFLFFSLNISAGGMEDRDLFSKVVGSWVPPKGTYSIGTIVEYKVNGSFIVNLYETDKCEILVSDYYGDWDLKDGKLITVVKGNTQYKDGGVNVPNGYMNIDLVISVDAERLVLKTESDEIVRRIRSLNCVTET